LNLPQKTKARKTGGARSCADQKIERKTNLTGKNQDSSDWIESEREKSPRKETNKS
jgi:hypothetical protein